MKQLLTTLFLLAAIAGHGQTVLKLDTARDNEGNIVLACRSLPAKIDSTMTPVPQYDTLKIIAEVYELPEKKSFGKTGVWDDDCRCFKIVDDYYWPLGDSTHVYTYKVMGWEVWTREHEEWQPERRDGDAIYPAGNYTVPAEKIKTLTFNKKETLSHVLQSWRVEW